MMTLQYSYSVLNKAVNVLKGGKLNNAQLNQNTTVTDTVFFIPVSQHQHCKKYQLALPMFYYATKLYGFVEKHQHLSFHAVKELKSHYHCSGF